jgi:hypothetical protein
VTFSPAKLGTNNAILQVSGPGIAPFDVLLQGNGFDPLQAPSDVPPPVVNPSTGFGEQSLTIANEGGVAVGGMQLRIYGVPEGVEVVGGTFYPDPTPTFSKYNRFSWLSLQADGSSGYWIVNFTPVVDSGTSASVVVQYRYIAEPVNFSTSILLEAPPSEVQPPDPEFSHAIQSLVPDRAAGTGTLRFHSRPGRSYRIERSGDLASWLSATSTLTSRSNILEWTDNDAFGDEQENRTLFYRVLDVTP